MTKKRSLIVALVAFAALMLPLSRLVSFADSLLCMSVPSGYGRTDKALDVRRGDQHAIGRLGEIRRRVSPDDARMEEW